MSGLKETEDFLEQWRDDPQETKPIFVDFCKYLGELPNSTLEFKSRPGVSYSLRAKNHAQRKRSLFVLVDVVDDEPESRWLSVCFYDDMISDPDELGDFVPEGLLGENARCFNLDEETRGIRDYVFARLREAASAAAE